MVSCKKFIWINALVFLLPIILVLFVSFNGFSLVWSNLLGLCLVVSVLTWHSLAWPCVRLITLCLIFSLLFLQVHLPCCLYWWHCHHGWRRDWDLTIQTAPFTTISYYRFGLSKIFHRHWDRNFTCWFYFICLFCHGFSPMFTFYGFSDWDRNFFDTNKAWTFIREIVAADIENMIL